MNKEKKKQKNNGKSSEKNKEIMNEMFPSLL